MRPTLFTLALSLGLSAGMHAQAAPGCTTALCQAQVSCPNGTTTTITGKILAPNGVDPIPNVLVYVPNAVVPPLAVGLSCPVVGAPPLGSPLVGATSAVDGTFVITNAPVGTAIPLVAVTGKWRRQTTVDTSMGSCATTIVASDTIRMPKNHTEGDIPKFAIATGSADSVECVLLKVGIDQAEFTNPAGTGRINLFPGSDSPGATIAGTAAAPVVGQEALMSNATSLANYDVLMLPCQGTYVGQADGAANSANDLPDLRDFANNGGRIYASHYSDIWFYDNPQFANTAKYTGHSSTTPPDPNPNGPNATVDTTFAEGATLAKWLPLVGASTTPNEIEVFTLRQDTTGVNSPTQAWLRLNNAAGTVMQFVFNTPISSTNQCGRVLYNEYHVETPIVRTATSGTFPNECDLTAAITPQEKLLEFSLFALTNDGGAFVLTPTTQDFGNQYVGFPSAPANLTFTNNAIFNATVSSAVASPNFAITSNGCGNVAPGASCQIGVAFVPTTTGPLTGTATIGAAATSLIAALTGNGVDFTLAVAPTSGQVIAGYGMTPVATLSAIAGFAFPVSLSCSTNAPGSTCTPALTSVVPGTATPVNIAITTTPQYVVIGYSGFGNSFLLSLLALTSASLLFYTRRNSLSRHARMLMFTLLLAALGGLTTGCSGKLPARNPIYTAAGTYTYTITASSGPLSHSATYSLNVTSK